MRSPIRAPAVVTAAASIFAVSAIAQQTATPALDEGYEVARTPWGHPDLQGVWDYRTITPMQRDRELGDRQFYTEAEVAELEGRAAARMDEAPAGHRPAL